MNHLIKLKFPKPFAYFGLFFVSSSPVIEFDEGEFKIILGSSGGYWHISTLKWRLENTFGRWE